jgi:hypothetical protein
MGSNKCGDQQLVLENVMGRKTLEGESVNGKVILWLGNDHERSSYTTAVTE